MQNKSLATLARQILIVRGNMGSEAHNGNPLPLVGSYDLPVPLTYKSGGHTSAMIALFLPNDIANMYALRGMDGALPPDDLHLTITYLGKVDKLSYQQIKNIHYQAEMMAGIYGPLKGHINGVGRFCNGEENDPFVIIPDLPTLPNFRYDLVKGLGLHDIPVANDHGFTPHITLAYLPHNSFNPYDNLDREPIVFPTVSVVLGNDRYDYPFFGDGTIKALIQKIGARHTGAERELIQKMHDLTLELGAECHPLTRRAGARHSHADQGLVQRIHDDCAGLGAECKAMPERDRVYSSQVLKDGEVTKHLAGKHRQKTHGGGKGSKGGEPKKKTASSITSKLPKNLGLMDRKKKTAIIKELAELPTGELEKAFSANNKKLDNPSNDLELRNALIFGKMLQDATKKKVAKLKKKADLTDSQVLKDGEVIKGSAGSGNFGHDGRKGKRGGSSRGGGLRRIGAKKDTPAGDRKKAAKKFRDMRAKDRAEVAREKRIKSGKGAGKKDIEITSSVEKLLNEAEKKTTHKRATILDTAARINAVVEGNTSSVATAIQVLEAGGFEKHLETMTPGSIWTEEIYPKITKPGKGKTAKATKKKDLSKMSQSELNIGFLNARNHKERVDFAEGLLKGFSDKTIARSSKEIPKTKTAAPSAGTIATKGKNAIFKTPRGAIEFGKVLQDVDGIYYNANFNKRQSVTPVFKADLTLRAQSDAPNYAPASTPQRCENCAFFLGDPGRDWCELFDFTADPDYHCDDWDAGKPDEIPGYVANKADLAALTEGILILRGGPTSGNWGHSGRKGKRGGSGGGGGFKRIGVKPGSKPSRKKVQAAAKKQAKDISKPQAKPKAAAKKPLTQKELQKLNKKLFDESKSGKATEKLTSKPKIAPAAKKPVPESKPAAKKRTAKEDRVPKTDKTAAGDVKNAKATNNKIMTKNSEDWQKNLSSAEMGGLQAYQGSQFQSINGGLRGSEKSTAASKKDIRNIDKALSKSPLKEDTVVFRSMDENTLEKLLGPDKKKWTGQGYSDKGYTSTSIDPGGTGGFRGIPMEIRVPKGTPAGYLANLPGGGVISAGEKELLLGRGQKFRILKVKGGRRPKIIAEVIN